MKAAPLNYVLIDYENIQPKDLHLLRQGDFRVRIFLGPKQVKIPLNLATALQPLGSNAEYVLLESGGKNALDFHIAFYLGVLSCQEPSAYFHIISKDGGFDALIEHLKGRGISIRRSACIAGILAIKHALPQTIEAQVETVIADLVRRNSSKPRTQKSLRGTVHALFKGEASEGQLSNLIDRLCERGIVKIEGTTVSYRLPPEIACGPRAS